MLNPNIALKTTTRVPSSSQDTLTSRVGNRSTNEEEKKRLRVQLFRWKYVRRTYSWQATSQTLNQRRQKQNSIRDRNNNVCRNRNEKKEKVGHFSFWVRIRPLLLTRYGGTLLIPSFLHRVVVPLTTLFATAVVAHGQIDLPSRYRV
jgi:hypothetical protein